MMPRMRRSFLCISTLVAVAIAAPLAYAQSTRETGGATPAPKAPGPGTTMPVKPVPAPSPTTPPAPSAAPALQLPSAPNVDDPMLAPVPRPKTEIATWEEALQYLRSRSTDLQIAVQEVFRAEAQTRVALAAVLPTITGTGAVTHNIITNDVPNLIRGADGSTSTKVITTPYPNYLTGQLSLSQSVINLRSWYAIGTADYNIGVTKLTVEDTKRVIALKAANAIVGVVTAERVAELNRAGLLNSLQRLDLADRKTQLGNGTGLDVVRAKQDVEVARATLVDGDESLRQAREALGIALGLPEQVGVPPSVDINGLESSARASCRQTSKVDDRADIAALRGQIDLAHRARNDVKLGFLPQVDLRSGLSTTTVDTGSSPTTTWNVQGVLTVPIWDGGARYGNLRDTEAQELEAVQKLEAARRQAIIDNLQAQRGVTVAESRRTVAQRARDLAAENDRLTRASYLEGRGTSLELITAAQALRAAEIQLALQDFGLVKARILAVLTLSVCPW